MESRGKFNFKMPSGRTLGYAALGILLGLLVPAVAPAQLVLSPFSVPVLMLGAIFPAWLRGKAGRLPAAAMLVTELLAALNWYGPVWAAMLLVAVALPAVVTMEGMAKKRPFSNQLGRSTTVFLLGVLAALGIARLSFGDFKKLSDFVVATVNLFISLIPQWELERVAEIMRQGSAVMNGLTTELLRGQMMASTQLMMDELFRTLPGTLFSGAMISGMLATLWGNWAMARRGLATNESFAGMSRWFLKESITWGALALWVTAQVMRLSGMENAGAVVATVNMAVGTQFCVLALAALDRSMLKAGRELPPRRLLITLLAIGAMLSGFVRVVLAVMGVFQGLFGAHGALRKLMDRWGPKR